MSEKQAKAARRQRIVLKSILLTMEDGQTFNIDPHKVQIIDRESGKPLFDIVQESEAVAADQPSIEVVQDGNWTGVKVNKGKQS